MAECTNQLSQAMYDELEKFIDSLPNLEGELIQVLHKAQDIFGYLPAEVQSFIAKKLGVPAAKVYGVVTFYSYFSMEPKGKYNVSVCMGTACYVCGSEDVLNEFKQQLGIDAGETDEDGLFSLCALRCVGACGLAPVVMVNDQVFGRVTKDMVKDIVAKFKD